MVYRNFAQYNVTTKQKFTVLSNEDKITIYEHGHLDKGSSKSEITTEYKITVSIYFIRGGSRLLKTGEHNQTYHHLYC